MPIILERFSDQVGFWPDAETPGQYHLDVRDMILDGGSPYEVIMDCVSQITEDSSLVVHAIFEPKPLIRQLERMGLKTEIAQVGPDHWAITVTRTNTHAIPEGTHPGPDDR